jgi:hypothetical protein
MTSAASSADARARVALAAKVGSGGTVRVKVSARTAFRGSLAIGRTRLAVLKLRKGSRRTVTLSSARLRTVRAGCRIELRLVTARGTRIARTRVARRCASNQASPAAGGIGSPPAAARTPAAGVPAPTTTPPSPAGTSLRWAPPALTSPTVIELGTGYTYTRMDPARDYVIKLPPVKKIGATVLDGGRNVVVIGGQVTIPADTPAGAANDSYRRALYIKNATGTVHLEGIEIDGSGGGESDAIAISAPNATVQVENVRAIGLRGGYSSWHADVIQPWGGVKALRVDGLTATSNYQGLQLNRDKGPIGSASLRRVDLAQSPGPYDRGGFMLWLTNQCDGYPVGLDQVYVTPRAGRSVRDSVWPGFACDSQLSGGSLTWSGLPVAGGVRGGPPPGGSFVPPGAAGALYRTPGYA